MDTHSIYCICHCRRLKYSRINNLLHRWWAHEHGRKEIISLLKSVGVSEKLRDKDGITPLELNEDEF